MHRYGKHDGSGDAFHARVYSREIWKTCDPSDPSDPKMDFRLNAFGGQKGQKGHIKMKYNNYSRKEAVISE